MELGIGLVLTGALLVVAGVVFTAGKALWRGRLSEPRTSRSGVASGTLEPRETGSGFGLRSNWPGLALIALGALLLLAGAVV